MINLFEPYVSKVEKKFLLKTLESKWWGLGPTTTKFEEEIGKFLGNPNIVALNSGTAALHLSLILEGIGKGDEVLVPVLTFVSTAHVVEYVGAKPVFVDVNYDTLNISLEDTLKKITKKTKAIMMVHYGGNPALLYPFQELAEDFNLKIIEDAAHAFGAEYDGKKIGTFNTTAFSAHAVKCLSMGEGGFLALRDGRQATQAKELRWLGINKGTYDRTISIGKQWNAWQYDVNGLGYKYGPSDLLSSIGLAQLQSYQKIYERKCKIANRYREGLNGIPNIELTPVLPYVKNAHHLFVIKATARDGLFSFFKQNDIAGGMHYYPIHLHNYYQKYKSSCPVAEDVWKKLISLPFHANLSDKEVDKVISVIKKFYEVN